MSARAPTSAPERGDLLAWAGVLIGPTAWAAQLFGNWAMGEFLACGPAVSRSGRLVGVPVTTFAAVVNALLLAATIASGVLSFMRLRTVRERGDTTPGQRATWLPIAGVMTSVLFAIVIAMSYMVVVVVEGCWG